MPDRPMIGTCEDCHKRFEFTMHHNGVNNSSYAYCERCGSTAILDVSDSRFPVDLLKKSAYKVIASGMESHLKPCSCGGRFTAKATPQCPYCRQPLSPLKAAVYIEMHAPKSAPDWRWQMNWTGNYCITIEGKEVRNNFKQA